MKDAVLGVGLGLLIFGSVTYGLLMYIGANFEGKRQQFCHEEIMKDGPASQKKQVVD